MEVIKDVYPKGHNPLGEKMTEKNKIYELHEMLRDYMECNHDWRLEYVDDQKCLMKECLICGTQEYIFFPVKTNGKNSDADMDDDRAEE